MSTVKPFKSTLGPFLKSEIWSGGSVMAIGDCSQTTTDRNECETLDCLPAARGLQTLGHLQILVVEDFKPFSTHLCGILSTLGFTEVAQAHDGEEAVALAQNLQPDLMLLDLGLPKLSGMEVARKVRGISPKSRILIVSSETSREFIEAAMAAGASGYVFKYCASTDVALAIRAILSGETFVSSRLT